MSRGLNKVMLIGRLGGDPELKYTPSGVPVANFSIATDDEWPDKETGEKKKVTEWHRIVVWRKLAEICGQYLKKGSQVYVEGKLQTRSWEDQNGVKRYTTEIVIRDMQMLGSKTGDGSRQGPPAPEEPPAYFTGSEDQTEDDIPF